MRKTGYVCFLPGVLQMSYAGSVFVGRVGALAVALGVGYAMFGGQALLPAARADSTSANSSTGSASPGTADGARHGGGGSPEPAGPGADSIDHPAGGGRSVPDDHETPLRPKSLPDKSTQADAEESDDESEQVPGAGPAEEPPPPQEGPADAGRVKPVRSVDVALAGPGDTPDSVTDIPDPAGPVKEVAEAALLAVSRRESIDTDENDADQKKMPPPVAMTVNSLSLQANSSSDDAESAPAAAATVQIPVTPTPGYEIPADWESAYTGQPSFIAQVLVSGLQIVQVVAKFFGFQFSLDAGDGTPPTGLMFGTDVTKEQYIDADTGAIWDEWIITPKAPTGKRVIALHGGGFVTETSLFTFLTYSSLATGTGATVVVPVYPVVSKGGRAKTVVPVTANLISSEVLSHGADNVSVLGDSAGGNLGLAALELLAARIRNGEAAPESMPGRLVLLSAGLDSNDPIENIPFIEPYLDVPTIRKAKAIWMQGLDLKDPLGSPIYGSLDGLPPVTVYSSSVDASTFQTLRLRQKVADEHNTNFTFVLRKGLLHDWTVFFFLPDAWADWPGIHAGLGLTSPAGDVV